MKIDIGATVKTLEGDELGKVERVILDPTTRDVNALVVHKGLIVNRDVVVPISLVQRADKKEVELRIGRSYLNDLPDFVNEHYVERTSETPIPYSYAPGSVLFPLHPPFGVPGVPGPFETAQQEAQAAPLELDIVLGTEVRTVDGPIGVVGEVRTDPLSDRVTDIVVSRGKGAKKDILVPVEYIAEISADHIKLSLTNEMLDELPLPVTDRYIVVEGDEGQRK